MLRILLIPWLLLPLYSAAAQEFYPLPEDQAIYDANPFAGYEEIFAYPEDRIDLYFNDRVKPFDRVHAERFFPIACAELDPETLELDAAT